VEQLRGRSVSLRNLKGPLVPYVGAFGESLRDQGYSRSSIDAQSRLVSDFCRWLEENAVAGHKLSPRYADRYLRHRARRRCPSPKDGPILARFLELLCKNGVIALREAPTRTTPTQQLIAEFILYLRQERELAPATLANYLPVVRCFLTECFGRDRPLSSLCATNVIEFVQRRALRQSIGHTKLTVSALRSFLRYARYRDYVKIDLAAGVPAVASWSMATIPRSIAPEHVQKILARCDRESAVGRRDYAILLLLARLGLRAGEVAFIELEDIDWNVGCLIVRGKGDHGSALPLPADVGEAIADYLQRGRPFSTDRHVFLRAKAPIGGFAHSQAVSSVVRRALIRGGIDSPRKGAHQFRHGLACEMLRRGASLAEIGHILRHRDPQTTAIYAKVDLASLRTLALPWPGAAS
jgi:integrase/recombinase XerD